MVEGGVILVDDYNFKTCPGAMNAVDQYLTENHGKCVKFAFQTGQCGLVYLWGEIWRAREFPDEYYTKYFGILWPWNTERIKLFLDHTPVHDMNFKWKKDISKEQREELEALIVEDEFRRTFKDWLREGKT